MIQLINNISKVESIEAYHLEHADIIRNKGILLNVTQIFTEIPIVGLASCRISDKIEGCTRVYTSELKMHCCNQLQPEGKKLCFRLTTVTGKQFLLGTWVRPYPVITNDELMPSRRSDRSGSEVSVKLVAVVPLLAILD